MFLGIGGALVKLTEEALEAGVDPLEAIERAHMVGIQKVGELFEAGEYFLPEMVGAAIIVKEAIIKLQRLIPQDKIISKGKIVMGTVQGDIHDIGKDLVSMWLSTRGIEIVDIGVDCHVDKFIDHALEENADIIGASCLLTTTAPELKKLVERVKERGLKERFKVLVGGAAVHREWVEEIGADGFGQDMKEALDVASFLLTKCKGG